MSFASEFKEFAMKGNVIDLAVGVVIGAAFGKIVSSLVGDVVMPLLAPLLGQHQFQRPGLHVATGADGKPVLVKYGAFLQTCFEFLIIALVIFMVIKAINRLSARTRMHRRRRRAGPNTVAGNQRSAGKTALTVSQVIQSGASGPRFPSWPGPLRIGREGVPREVLAPGAGDGQIIFDADAAEPGQLPRRGSS